MARTPLSDDVIQSALAGLPGWAHLDGSLKKDFRFGSFREAISFIVRVSFEAEQLDHHPEIGNVYNRVTITLRTHDAGNKVTQADLDLAGAIESFSWV
jgi:4a-hydroxytetrahydrobiopterin dehydratase